MKKGKRNPSSVLIYEEGGQTWLNLSALYSHHDTPIATGLDGKAYPHLFPTFSTFTWQGVTYEVQGRDPSCPRLWITPVTLIGEEAVPAGDESDPTVEPST